MNVPKAALEAYRRERKSRAGLLRRLFRRPVERPRRPGTLSQRTFARLLVVHCENLRVRG